MEKGGSKGTAGEKDNARCTHIYCRLRVPVYTVNYERDLVQAYRSTRYIDLFIIIAPVGAVGAKSMRLSRKKEYRHISFNTQNTQSLRVKAGAACR